MKWDFHPEALEEYESAASYYAEHNVEHYSRTLTNRATDQMALLLRCAANLRLAGCEPSFFEGSPTRCGHRPLDDGRT